MSNPKIINLSDRAKRALMIEAAEHGMTLKPYIEHLLEKRVNRPVKPQ